MKRLAAGLHTHRPYGTGHARTQTAVALRERLAILDLPIESMRAEAILRGFPEARRARRVAHVG
ncbi:MAG TPA: hypothetical protein VKW09_14415 [bacterium]|nr:hypothetical protein [bacterium]